MKIVFAEKLFVNTIVKNKNLPEKTERKPYLYAVEFFISVYVIVDGTMSFGNIFACEQD